MNPYLKNLSKLEFVMTDACTGSCKHCSEGAHTGKGERIDSALAVDALCRIAAEYDIETVMTFGGEPLLFTEGVCAIMSAAKDLAIPRRQIITNGYFSSDADRVHHVARALALAGVNDLLVSVDAFHQETIPLDIVRMFALSATEEGIPTRFQPAWLVSATDDNPYNRKTRRILDSLRPLGILAGEGNVVFPEGNAKVYFAEYFQDTQPKNPYVEDPHDVRCLSFSPNGDVLDGNMYRRDVMEIVRAYTP